MTRNRPDEYVGGEGAVVDQNLHPLFAQQRLVFAPGLMVTRTELADTYATWQGIFDRDRRGRLRYSTTYVHNLFAFVREQGAVENEHARLFLNLGLRPLRIGRDNEGQFLCQHGDENTPAPDQAELERILTIRLRSRFLHGGSLSGLLLAGAVHHFVNKVLLADSGTMTDIPNALVLTDYSASNDDSIWTD